jgi:hypothetical protein
MSGRDLQSKQAIEDEQTSSRSPGTAVDFVEGPTVTNQRLAHEPIADRVLQLVQSPSPAPRGGRGIYLGADDTAPDKPPRSGRFRLTGSSRDPRRSDAGI